MPKTQDWLTIIVPCRGRLEFIKQTIEAAVAQPNADYIFVDYSCPQKSGDWVRTHYPKARVVTVDGRDYWRASEARNAGAKYASGGWLCFVDGDIVLAPEFSESILALVKPGTYLIAPKKPGIYGLTICAKDDFDRIGGYDEILRKYRGEDVEIRVSLDRIGLKAVELPESLVSHIDHDDELRASDPSIKEQMATDNINVLYVYIKDYLIRNGEPHDSTVLQELVTYCQERFFAGFPWLAWPDPDQPLLTPDVPFEFADNHYGTFSYVFRALASIARGYRSISVECFGGARAFTIERAGQTPILELLTIYKRQTVTVRAKDRSQIAVMSMTGVVSEIALENGEATIELSCQPIFLLDEAVLVKDIEVTLAPSAKPALMVGLVPSSGFAGTVDVAMAVCGQPEAHQVVQLDTQAVLVEMPILYNTLERPEDITVRVTGPGFAHEITRRTTFVSAVKVTTEEAVCVSPPDRAYLFMVDGCDDWRDVIPASYQGHNDLHVDVAWGWTDTALVCWIARYDDVPLDGRPDCDGAQIAVDGMNHKALFAPGYEFRLRWQGDRSWVECQKFLFGSTTVLPDLLIREESGHSNKMAVRLPFEILGVTPHSGKAIGVSMQFSDNDGDGLKGWLEWGGGIAPGKNGRSYNEIILE